MNPLKIAVVICADGKRFERANAVCIGTVRTPRQREIDHEEYVGRYPVFVEQSGSYRLFTYTSKVTKVLFTDGN